VRLAHRVSSFFSFLLTIQFWTVTIEVELDRNSDVGKLSEIGRREKLDKDFHLYLDEESYNKLKEEANKLDITLQDYIYHKIFFFFLNNQELPEKSELRGGGKYIHLRIPERYYKSIKELAKEKKIKQSEVLRRIIWGGRK